MNETYQETNDLSYTNAVAERRLPIGRDVQARPIWVLSSKSLQPSRMTEERFQLYDQLLTICLMSKTYKSNIVTLHDKSER